MVGIIKKLQKYGCHCFPGVPVGKAGGHGPHVDKMDWNCKMLARRHKCIEMEYPDMCDYTGQGKYRYATNSITKEIDCSMNTEPCKKAQCECDKKFAERMGAMWKDRD